MFLKLKAAAASLAVAAGLATIAQAEDYPKMKLTYAHMVPAGNALGKFDALWAERVMERSGGNIEIEIFWAGAMGGPLEIADLVGSGAVDMGSTALGYMMDKFPLSGVIGNSQRVFKDPTDAKAAFEAINALPSVQAELDRANLKLLYTTAANEYNLTCTKPLTKVEDFKGRRIRAGGKYVSIFFNELGAEPQTGAFTEIYGALEKGLIDCAWMAHDFAVSSKLNEVAKYAIDLNLGAVTALQLLVNKDKFNALPQNVQDLMIEVAAEINAEEIKYLAEVFDKTIADMPSLGMEYVHFEEEDKFREMEPNMPNIWAEQTAEAGLEAEAKEISALLQTYRDRLNE